MNVVDIPELAGVADDILTRYGAGLDTVVPMHWLAGRMFGRAAPIVRVDRRALPHAALASLSCVAGAWRVYTVRGLSEVVERFAIGHELGHLACGHGSVRDRTTEREADIVAARLIIPRDALRAALRSMGEDIERLAPVFVASQTSVALRLGEAGHVPAVAVVAPARVYVRSLSEYVLPPEPVLRAVARRRGAPGLAAVRLTDDRRRTALLATA